MLSLVPGDSADRDENAAIVVMCMYLEVIIQHLLFDMSSELFNVFSLQEDGDAASSSEPKAPKVAAL